MGRAFRTMRAAMGIGRLWAVVWGAIFAMGGQLRPWLRGGLPPRRKGPPLHAHHAEPEGFAKPVIDLDRHFQAVFP